MLDSSCHHRQLPCLEVDRREHPQRAVERRLWNISKYSTIALASSTPVRQVCRSSSSTCIRDLNDSIIALW
jgi:hypothetical protein